MLMRPSQCLTVVGIVPCTDPGLTPPSQTTLTVAASLPRLCDYVTCVTTLPFIHAKLSILKIVHSNANDYHPSFPTNKTYNEFVETQTIYYQHFNYKPCSEVAERKKP